MTSKSAMAVARVARWVFRGAVERPNTSSRRQNCGGSRFRSDCGIETPSQPQHDEDDEEDRQRRETSVAKAAIAPAATRQRQNEQDDNRSGEVISLPSRDAREPSGERWPAASRAIPHQGRDCGRSVDPQGLCQGTRRGGEQSRRRVGSRRSGVGSTETPFLLLDSSTARLPYWHTHSFLWPSAHIQPAALALAHGS
jgi:hypothetical protein